MLPATVDHTLNQTASANPAACGGVSERNQMVAFLAGKIPRSLLRGVFKSVAIVCIPSILLLFVLCSPACASAAITIDADSQHAYATELFAQGNFELAVIEYQRFIHFFPQDPRVADAMYHVGLALFHDQRIEAAIDAFRAVIDTYEESDQALRSYFQISEAQMALGASGSAILTLQNLLTASRDPDIRDEAYYRLGWIHVERAEWDRAREYFERIGESNRIQLNIQRILDELAREKQIKRKSPRLAGVLSIIPGGGFFYCERYQDAFTAFLLNGGLIWATYEAFDNDLPALGACITFVEFGFYAGNIYGGVASAHKYNRKLSQNFIDQLKANTKISLGADPTGGIALAFNFSF
jgi:TolA-binding protein